MKQNLTELIDDERAVSPVIGVILMVAITVILAAVIGTFVLDLGQSAGNSAPQASLTVDVSVANDNVTVNHEGGDGLDSANTRVIITIAGSDSTWSATGSSDVLAVGDSVDFDFAPASDTAHASGPWSTYAAEDTGGTDNSISSGNEITVTLIDTESQRVIFESTVTA